MHAADLAAQPADPSVAGTTLPGNAAGPGAHAGAADRVASAAELKDLRRQLNTLPGQARRYLDRIEELVEAPIAYVSVGTRRDQIIGLHAAAV